MAEYSLEPVEVKKVSTRFRSIQTKLPVPESLAIFKTLEQSEPRSMMGMPPVIWDKAEDFIIPVDRLVFLRFGNQYRTRTRCHQNGSQETDR